VLRCFTPERPELGASEIARSVGLTQPTVWRLCQTLIALGYLVQQGSGGKLRLGLPVLQLGHAVLASEDFGQLARPYMQEIATRYRAGVSLGLQDGAEMLYLQRCIGGSVRFANWTIGSRVGMLDSAMGWACLAALPAKAGQAILQPALASGQPRTAELARAFEAALPAFRKKGFIVVQGALSPDICSVAVPLRSGDPTKGMALSCGGVDSPSTPALLDQLGADLLELAGLLEPAVPRAMDYRE